MATVASSLPLDEGARLRGGAAISWGAILSGAAVAVALSLVLTLLGAGFGFASMSAEPGEGLAAGTFKVAGAIWLIVTQWVSAGTGGYIAGRLRHRWLATHWHESYFRDTAHGLTVWSVATLVTALLLAGSLGHMAGGAMHGAGVAMHAGGPMHGDGLPPGGPRGAGPGDHEFERLFRPSVTAAPTAPGPDARGEAMHLLAGAPSGLNAEDRQYLVQLITARTGVTNEEAQQRLDTFIGEARATAEAARKLAAKTAIYTALSMLIGAFIASVAARLGGHGRDEHL